MTGKVYQFRTIEIRAENNGAYQLTDLYWNDATGQHAETSRKSFSSKMTVPMEPISEQTCNTST